MADKTFLFFQIILNVKPYKKTANMKKHDVRQKPGQYLLMTYSPTCKQKSKTSLHFKERL